ncbi:MAG: AsmA-like C-terminal region-containing protein, partial [Saprospiraceae bacterium]
KLLSELEDFKIRGTKNWFTIKDGRVDVQPFDVDVKNIAMNIAGSHGLDQTLAYNIKAKIPRSLLGNGTVGAAANKGLDFLAGQASKLGLNIANSEFVNVQIGLTGSVTQPKIDIKLLGGEGESSVADVAKEEVKEQINEIKKEAEAEVKEKVNEQKDLAEARAKEIRDSIQRAAEQKAAAARKKAEAELAKKAEEAKEKIGEEAANKAKELLDGVVTDTVKNEIKDKLKDFNPFKKKKKDGGN